MNQESIEKARDMMKRMKGDIRQILNDYATEASELAVREADPHTPVIQAAQIALANAATDYMVLCGDNAVEALNDVVQCTGLAMKQWTETAVRSMGLKAQTTVEKTIVTPDDTPAGKPN